MTPTRARWLAWSLAAVSVAVTGAGLWLRVLNHGSVNSGEFAAGSLVTDIAYGVLPALIGGLIAARRPSNPLGWLLISISLVGISVLGDEYGQRAVITAPGSLPFPSVGAAVAAVSTGLGFSFFVFVPLLFPNGRPLASRWRWVVRLAVAGIALIVVGTTLNPHPTDIDGRLTNPLGVAALGDVRAAVEGVGAAMWGSAVVLSVISAVLRFRRSAGIERQQMKWFTYAVFVMPVALAVANATFERPLIAVPAAIIGSSAVPVAIAVSVLRYRLYEIDRIINRTVVYAVLTGVLAIAYVGPVVLLQQVLPTSGVAVALSTLLTAALVQPLRRRVQGFVDRRFYRRKYDATRTVEAFSARLRQEVDLDELRRDLVGVVQSTMQPAAVQLWLRG